MGAVRPPLSDNSATCWDKMRQTCAFLLLIEGKMMLNHPRPDRSPSWAHWRSRSTSRERRALHPIWAAPAPGTRKGKGSAAPSPCSPGAPAAGRGAIMHGHEFKTELWVGRDGLADREC
jgi:hypothetical protein